MKKHLLKIILGGLVVFFSLPLIFDGDAQDIASATRSRTAAAQDEQEQEMLPVVPTALPFQSQNVLEKYASRFKKFYVDAKKEKSKIKQDVYQAESGAMYASADTARNSFDNSSRTASNQEEDMAKEYFADVMADNSSKPVQTQPQAAIPYGAAATKQKIHDNAPVKGLYESSAVDSYESRAQAKEVYTNVMNKVDGTATETQAQRDSIVSLKQAAPMPQTAEDKQATAKESKYIGIASKNTYGAKAANDKAYGGFGGGGVSAKTTGSANAASMGDFESSASTVESKTEEVAQDKIVRHFTTTGGGTAGGATSSQQATTVKPTASNPQVQPQQPSTPGQQGSTSPSGQGPGEPTPSKEDLFDLNKWTSKYTVSCNAASLPPTTENNGEQSNITVAAAMVKQMVNIGEKDAEKQGTEQSAQQSEVTPKKEKLNPGCHNEGLPQIDPKVKEKYEILVIAGKTKKGYAIPSEMSLTGFLFAGQEAKYKTLGTEIPNSDYNEASAAEVANILKDKNVIVVTSVGDIKGINSPQGDIEYKDGYKKVVDEINQFPAKRAAEIKAAQEAAELKAKQKEEQIKAQQESDKKDLAEAVNKYTKK